MGDPRPLARPGPVVSEEELLPQVYEQLRRTAQKYLAQERPGHTLEATALVHEAFARLDGGNGVLPSGRPQFYFAMATAMRRILTEHARSRSRLKRGGDGARAARRVSLEGIDLARQDDCESFLMLDDAIRRLEAEDRQAADVVRLRYFAGLSVAETAEALGISTSTVDREWAFARARLYRLLESDNG